MNNFSRSLNTNESSPIQLPELSLSVGSKRRIFRVIVKKNEFGAIVEFEEIESEKDSKEKSFFYRTWKWRSVAGSDYFMSWVTWK